MPSAQNVRSLVSRGVAPPPSEGFGMFKALLHLFQNPRGVLYHELHFAWGERGVRERREEGREEREGRKRGERERRRVGRWGASLPNSQYIT